MRCSFSATREGGPGIQRVRRGPEGSGGVRGVRGVREVRGVGGVRRGPEGPERSERSGRVLGGPTGPGVGNGSQGHSEVTEGSEGPECAKGSRTVTSRKKALDGGSKGEREGQGSRGAELRQTDPRPDPSGPLGPLTLRTRWRGSGYERAQRIQPRLTPKPRVQGCARGSNRVRLGVRGAAGPCSHPPGERGRTPVLGYYGIVP